jgi:hypothetical protein
MGGSSSSLVPKISPTGFVKDTTLRSVVFGKKDLEFIKDSAGQMILKDQVTPEKFLEYENILKRMGALSRLIYCDSGIIRNVIQSSAFKQDNKAINEKINQENAQFLPQRRQASTAPESIEGRPMQSYILNLASQATTQFGHYVSSPADLTFMFIKGDKCGLLPTDLVLAFKGSSTVDNFKHDLMSQFTSTFLETSMPTGLTFSSQTTGNRVPGSFLNQLKDSWEFLDAGLKKFAPTRLFVTGHSLGGAYASLYTFILAESQAFSGTIHLVTFGSPTVVDDNARNTFNAHLDSGKVTLDRVVSTFSAFQDFIPTIPALFSHPGFQPLRTEFYPEKTTGRAYNYETVKKVYQTGGAIGFTQAKRDYAQQTLTHAPNLVKISTDMKIFPHAGYFSMLWLDSFRMVGMKNPGFGTHTFVCDLFEEGIKFHYATPSQAAVSPPESDPSNDAKMSDLVKLDPAKKGGTRRRQLRRTHKQKSLKPRRK